MRDSWWLKFVSLAVILRVLLAAFLYHTDLKGIYNASTLISKYGWVEGYKEGIRENTPLPYPPPVYFIFSNYQKIGRFLFTRNFRSWIEGSDLKVGNYKGIFRDLIFMKLPLILIDLFVAWLLLKMVALDKRRLVTFIWLFNPFSLYAIYGISNFDIMPTALVLASAFYFRRSKTISYVLLGVGAGFKVFPILLIPFWLVLDDRQWLKKLRDLVIFGGSFAFCLLPIIRSGEVLSSVFFSNLTGGITRASLDIGNHETVPIYLVFYSLLLITAAFGYLKKVPIAVVPVAVFGSLLGLSNFHPQWMLWLMPFLLLLVVGDWLRWQLVLFLMFAFLGVVSLVDDIYMTFGILSPINGAFTSLPSVRQLVERVGVGGQLQGFFHAFFLAGLILAVVEILRGTKVDQKFQNMVPMGILKFSSLLGISLTAIVFLAHVFLSLKGAYIDVEHLAQRESVPLTRETIIRQDFTVSHDNFSGIQVMMKNVGLKNKSDIYFNLVDQSSSITLPFKINGGAIGDDYNLRLNFEKIRQSAGHRYSLLILSPQALLPTGETSMVVPYDGESGGKDFFINGKNVLGSLSYVVYYNPGGMAENLKYTFSNIISKI